MTPILLLEINEIPWRLIDRYAGLPEFASIRRFLRQAHQFTTVAVDTGELSPWVTWPTLHRGMNNERHGIKNLGQDPATFKGKPIWEEIREQGGSIGICGSMQSWPPIQPGENGFYVPDTFAHDESCRPPYLNPLQALNLSLVRINGRVVSRALPGASRILRGVSSFAKSGITPGTCARIAGQLLGEFFDRSITARRPIFQTILFWDVFRKHFNPRRPPQFSTFFTNHIAGVMHRYWHDVFPEDFPHGTPAAGRSREPLMRFSLRVLDDMLTEVLEWAALNPELVVIFASSMGQDAIHRGYHEGVEVVVEDLALLMSCTGISREDYIPLLAMVPRVAVEIGDSERRARARRVLAGAVCGEGKHFISVQEIGSSLSITVHTPTLKQMSGDTFFIDGRAIAWSEAGLRKQDIEPGTAYHIPEGSLAVYSEQMRRGPLNQLRSRVNADRVKDWMLAVSRDGTRAVPSLASVSS
jgi:hypothetical protein